MAGRSANVGIPLMRVIDTVERTPSNWNPWVRTNFLLWVATIAWANGAYGDEAIVGAKETVCSAVIVKSVSVSVDRNSNSLRSEAATVELEKSSDGTDASQKMSLVALGPRLTLLDSEDVALETVCTKRGFQVTALVTHRDGDVLKNPSWRPRISMKLVPRKRGALVLDKWRFQGENGVELHHIPIVSKSNLPIVVSKALP